MSNPIPTKLVPIEERQVNFYGDELTAVLVEIDRQNQIFVPIKPISDYLGLSWAGQSERIRRDPVLSEEMKLIRVTRINSTRGNPESLCLPLEFLNGWLFGVNVSRVKETLREQVIRYQRECYRVLWRAYQTETLTNLAKNRLVADDPRLAILTEQIEALADVTNFLQEHLEAVLETTGQVNTVSIKLDQAISLLEALTARQEQMTQRQAQLTQSQEQLDLRQAETEMTVDQIDERTQRLTPAHRRVVQNFVDSMVRATKNRTPPLTYNVIYGRLKNRFRAGSYGEIADERFDQVLAYLSEELRQATSGELPEQQSLF